MQSEEVVRSAKADVRELLLAGSRIELKEIILHEFIDLHNGGLVSATIAVVRCREDSDDVALVSPVVAVHDELMGACDPSEIVRVVELLRDVLTEAIASTTWRNTPTAPLIGIRPKQVANGAFVRSLLNAIELANLIKGVDAGGETTVKAEDGVLDNSRQRQEIEKLSELFPDVSISVLSEALIVEAISKEKRRVLA